MVNEVHNQFLVSTINDDAIMLLDGGIGDEVNGAEFAKELFYADTLGKKVIKLYINCIGGKVIDSYSIYNAILKTKTPVDTYNVGMCASSGNNIFQAGRKRYVNDYALTMVHPVSGADDPELTALFNNSIITMMMRRNNKSEEEIQNMVNNTTWMNAEDCVKNGFADEICYSGSSNKPRLTAKTEDIENNISLVKLYLNSIIIKSKDMKSITNKLNLNEGANEAQILASIEALENKAKVSKEELDAAKNALAEATNKTTELTNQYNELKAKYEAMEGENAAKEAAEIENKINVEVEAIKKAGKVADKPEAIEALKNAFKVNFESTKLLYDSMPVNKTGVNVKTDNINPAANSATPGAKAMLELRNKFNI